MFDSIRKHQRVLQFVLLILIFPAFVFFGVSGYDQFLGNDDSIARVGDQKISRGEFEQAQRRQLEQMQQMFGGSFDSKLLDNEASRNEILDGLISQRVLAELANKHHINVSDERLRASLLRIPGLQKPDGSFDMERYRALLSQQNLDITNFENQLRRDIALQALPEALAQTAWLPNQVIDRLIGLQEQRREVRLLTFAAKGFETGLKPSDEQLKQTYEANAKGFEVPESVKIEYIVLDAKSISGSVPIDAAKVREYFEQNKARYAVAEQRQASHILVAVPKDAAPAAKDAAKAKAQGLLDRAKSGGDFAKLAKENSDDKGSAVQGGDLGFFSADMMVKPFADAAFALKPNELSGVVESEFGFHIIRLAAIKAGSQPNFDQVKAEIEAEYRKQEGNKAFAKAAEEFGNLVYEQSDNLNAAAEKFKLPIQTAANLTRQGPAPAAGVPPIAAISHPKVLSALFSPDSIAKKKNIEAQEIAPNTLVAARVVEHSPASTRPMETVKDALTALWVKQESQRLAKQAAEAKLKELVGGASATGFEAARVVGRGQVQDIPSSGIEAIFKLSAEKLPAYTSMTTNEGGSAVVMLVSTIAPSEDLIKARRETLKQQYSQALAQQELNGFLEASKAKLKIEKNLKTAAKTSVN